MNQPVHCRQFYVRLSKKIMITALLQFIARKLKCHVILLKLVFIAIVRRFHERLYFNTLLFLIKCSDARDLAKFTTVHLANWIVYSLHIILLVILKLCLSSPKKLYYPFSMLACVGQSLTNVTIKE